MKSYTDIEQSKKLVEILPLESADMYYSQHPLENYYNPIPYIGNYSVIHNQIPCWSLAALLDVLPVGTEPHKQSDGSISYYYVEVYNNKKYFSTKRYDNPINACVEMIIKLHKKGLL